jgi:hypothetical protein
MIKILCGKKLLFSAIFPEAFEILKSSTRGDPDSKVAAVFFCAFARCA